MLSSWKKRRLAAAALEPICRPADASAAAAVWSELDLAAMKRIWLALRNIAENSKRAPHRLACSPGAVGNSVQGPICA